MKKIALMCSIVALCMAATGCGKAKTCRCVVPGTTTVHVINIDKGECSQIRSYEYHNMVEQDKWEMLVCTDYEFAIDSVYKTQD